jgi:hypothetical protein
MAAHAQSTAHGVLETVIVSTIGELRDALKKQKPEIIWTLPAWLPAVTHRIIYSMLALAVVALALGYSVEYCPKIVVDGVEISFSMKLTKPPAPH